MKNFLLALISVLLVMVLTKANAINVNEQPTYIKKHTILPTLSEPVYASEVPVAKIPTPAPKPAPVASSDAKAFIYAHESGNNPAAINKSSGACGLGQALPCSKMGCSLSDYACQDAWFTNYMKQRYGTWEAAVSFWRVHRWW